MAEQAVRTYPLWRWWVYQRERFPLVQHVPLIAAFSSSAVVYAWMLGGSVGSPSLAAIFVAFISSLIFFAQLRIADEFKDYAEDARYRPYRPVPRGLVSLRELGWLFAAGGLVQLGLALWLDPRLLGLLFLTWAYLGAMSKEFLIGDWLRARPLTYMLSHMAIMPLIDLYATGTEWIPHTHGMPLQGMPQGLFWFLLASLFNGIVIEVGRKIRSPEDEEAGVQTYSQIWGMKMAVAAWWCSLALTFACAIAAAMRVDFALPVGLVLGGLGLGALWTGGRLIRHPTPGAGGHIELVSGLWTCGLYLCLGLVPLIYRGALP